MKDMAHPVATQPAAAPLEGEIVALDPAIVERFAPLLEAIPEAGGDAVEGILAQIAAAEDPSGLDAPWRTDGLRDLVGRRLVIRGARRLPSDYEGGLGWFLVLDVVDAVSGEILTVTTGALSVVAQIAKAAALGAFPLEVIPREAAKPSRSGYRPMHLEIVRATARTNGGAR